MVRLDFETSLPDKIPPALYVYSAKKVTVDRRYVLNIIKRLGLMAKLYSFEWEIVDDWTVLTGRGAKIDVNNTSGAYRFKLGELDEEKLEIPFSIPEQNLEPIARDFVRKSGLVDERGQQLKVNKISYLREQTYSVEGKEGEVSILDAGVVLGREIDKVPVRGIGGFIMINIAADESVVGGHKVWRPLGSKIDRAEIKEPDSAIRELKRRLIRRKLDGEIRVVKADFCYFEMGQSKKQKYFEPTYAFVYEKETKNFPYKSIEVIPAIDKSRENWNPG